MQRLGGHKPTHALAILSTLQELNNWAVMNLSMEDRGLLDAGGGAAGNSRGQQQAGGKYLSGDIRLEARQGIVEGFDAAEACSGSASEMQVGGSALFPCLWAEVFWGAKTFGKACVRHPQVMSACSQLSSPECEFRTSISAHLPLSMWRTAAILV